MSNLPHRIRANRALRLLLVGLALSVSGCAHRAPDSGISWTAYRVRADASVGLNADSGWAAAANAPATVAYDQPFRLRVEVEGSGEGGRFEELRLEYDRGDGAWRAVGLSDFPYPYYAAPPLSVVTTEAYSSGEETQDLLDGSALAHEDGLGLSGLPVTPLFSLGGDSMEWEWPLVIRRFSDGPQFAEDGAVFRIRVVDARGRALPGLEPLAITGKAAPAHLGGTFIETPARIGPYQSSQGALYFLMEPTESDNRFMVVKSLDHGLSWREVDGPRRPSVGDLEGVGAAFHEGSIHILHQTSEAVLYHAFATEDADVPTEGWQVDSEVIAEPEEPPVQVAALAARPDGSLVAAYGGPDTIYLQFRRPDGAWSDAISLATDSVFNLSGCQLAVDSSGRGYLVYTAADGSGWLRLIENDGEISPPRRVADSLGTTEEESGAFLPVVTPASGGAWLFFRQADGMLHARRVAPDGSLGASVRVADRAVVSGPVDSDQVAADAIAYGDEVHVLFIDEATRSIFHGAVDASGDWSEPQKVIGGIDAAWVRGNLLRDEAGRPVYGFVYDAGSKGGAGMNRYHAIPLTR